MVKNVYILLIVDNLNNVFFGIVCDRGVA